MSSEAEQRDHNATEALLLASYHIDVSAAQIEKQAQIISLLAWGLAEAGKARSLVAAHEIINKALKRAENSVNN